MSSNQKYIELNNGAQMPAVGLGTWQINNEQDVRFAINNSLELGYRHFDTAFFYQNEHLLGEVLKEWLVSGRLRREELYITSKLPMIAMWAYRVNEYMKNSLRSLQLDYVDLYLVQFPVGLQYVDGDDIIPKDINGNVKLDPKISLEAVWKAMEHEVKVGRAKSIGISNFNQTQIERILLQCQIAPSVLQIEVNVYCQQKELRQFCERNNIHVTAYGPFGSHNPSLNNEVHKSIFNDSTVQSIASKYNHTPAQILLRFLVQSNASVIPKTVRLDRMRENIEVFDFQLTNEDMNELESLDYGKAGLSKKVYFSEMLKGIENHPEYPWRD